MIRNSPLKFLLVVTGLAWLGSLWIAPTVVPLFGVVHVVVIFLTLVSPPRARRPAVTVGAWGNGSYQLIDKISEGGMGVVYRARHLELQREVAVKQIQPARLTEDARTRFKREARVLSSLSNPHTINVFDAGIQTRSTLFYVMELLDGLNLQELVELQGPVTPARVIHILRQAVMSLSEAHEKGLVHRDLKPANIMVCRYGGEVDFVKVLDFGLVKSLQHDDGPDPVTHAGSLPGTPAFLAPEGISGMVDARADIYSLAAVGHYLLTAGLLFDEESVVGMARAQLSTIPPRASERTESRIPPELDDLIARCLEKDPALRPQGADELRASLEQLALAYPWTRESASERWRDIPEKVPPRPSEIPLPSEDSGAKL